MAQIETNLDSLLSLIGRQAVEIDQLRGEIQKLQQRIIKAIAEQEIARTNAQQQ